MPRKTNDGSCNTTSKDDAISAGLRWVFRRTRKRESPLKETSKAQDSEDQNDANDDEKAKVLGGEVIRKWKSTSRHGGTDVLADEDLYRKEEMWWSKLVYEEEHKHKLELSGKLVLLFEIVRMADTMGDKV